MERNALLRNFSGTVCVVGLALSTMNFNSTMAIEEYNMPIANYSFHNQNENSMRYCSIDSKKHFEQVTVSKLEQEATSLFGGLREATLEEQEGVNSYIKSISKYTGVNFFNLC